MQRVKPAKRQDFEREMVERSATASSGRMKTRMKINEQPVPKTPESGSRSRSHLIWAVLTALALRLLVVAYVFMVFGAYTKAAALVILGFNCLVSALTCIPIFFLARNSFGLRTATGAVWIWAFFPYAVYFSADSMWSHALVAMLLPTLLVIASYLETRTSLWMWAGLGLLWGFTALTTPVVLTIVPFLGGWICYKLHRNGKNWRKPALTAAFVLFATVAPWMVRNSRLFHRPVFLEDNFWMEVCVGNLGDGRYWWNPSVHPAGSNAELEEYRRLGESGYMQRERRQAFDFIQHHPALYLWRCIRRFVYIWTGFWSLNQEYLRE